MNISEVTANMKKVDCQGTITAIGKAREVNLKAGGTNTVSDATLKDESGEITVPLWGEHNLRVGDKVKIENGFSTSYKGKNQLSVGKFGRLTRL